MFLKPKIMIRIFAAVASVIMMITIFFMSAQNGEKSAELSGGVTESVLEKTDGSFSGLDSDKKAEKIEYIGKFVRKAAHVAEYFVLCGLFSVFALTFDINRLVGFGAATAGAVLYAISDEIHQLFVPGRCGLVKDVFIDLAGALVGAGFVCLIYFIAEKARKKKCGTE